MLIVEFAFPVPNCDIERQLMHTPITTPVTLPNLRYFKFQGVSTYLEALVHRITTPRLEKLQIVFFNQLMFSVLRLFQFVNATENLRFKSAKFKISDKGVDVEVYPYEGAEMYGLSIATSIDCSHLNWQVSSVEQIFNSLSSLFSAVGHLTLGAHNARIYHTEWESPCSKTPKSMESPTWAHLVAFTIHYEWAH